MPIEIKPLPQDKRGQCPAELSFGAAFADHMFLQKYDTREGWNNAEIISIQDIDLNLVATELHYGQEIYEGLRTYRTESGQINLKTSGVSIAQPAVWPCPLLGKMCIWKL
ncbi:hypothetical protein [Emcibacter nanhaiensis]|uniref:Probable branched-chain-amino-acid aminotransferase n=1 Tax=Emcibacter nanhaiensis TaxID=1505037 RepID=A0A501PGC1_9PROT|nr:hypothetical protein [Emcibacter nanhaiensis]TPD59539.1 hypothetical protein FIV46_10660 [Emcibacter nanhaiensis]